VDGVVRRWRRRPSGPKVVAIVSGGNIDLNRFAALVGACS
jgi:threonine dehydratase